MIGYCCCLRSVGGTKLTHDVGKVGVGGLLADEERAGDLPVGQALYQVLEDLILAGVKPDSVAARGSGPRRWRLVASGRFVRAERGARSRGVAALRPVRLSPDALAEAQRRPLGALVASSVSACRQRA